jgi:hypothetical protein
MGTSKTLLARFSLIGLVITIVVAASLGYLMQRDLIRDELAQAGALAATQVSAGVSPHLTRSDMAGPLTTARITRQP